MSVSEIKKAVIQTLKDRLLVLGIIAETKGSTIIVSNIPGTPRIEVAGANISVKFISNANGHGRRRYDELRFFTGDLTNPSTDPEDTINKCVKSLSAILEATKFADNSQFYTDPILMVFGGTAKKVINKILKELYPGMKFIVKSRNGYVSIRHGGEDRGEIVWHNRLFTNLNGEYFSGHPQVSLSQSLLNIYPRPKQSEDN